MSTKKKVLLGVAFSLDAAITIFLFVVSIIMLATMPKTEADYLIAQRKPGMIPYLQTHSTVYLLTCVLPLVILLIVNIYAFIKYIKKAYAKKKVELTDLSDEEKEKLRQELLNDLQKK